MPTHQDDPRGGIDNTEEEVAPQVPQIAVSRASTLASSKGSNGTAASKKASQERPAVPTVDTSRASYPHWRAGYHHSETWKRSHQPDPEWRVKWSQHCFQNGRVLIIDYISNEANVPDGGRRHITVATQEMQTLSELKRFYSDGKRVHDAALRVIHVQNAPWATQYLLKKFNIDHPSELVGMKTFSKWAKYEKPRQRNGKPFPTGRSWRGQTDPWRNVSRAAFGLDYMKNFTIDTPHRRKRQTMAGEGPVDAKLMHLNAYEDSQHAPYGYDTCVQRLSVYVQRNLGPPSRVSPDIDIKNPYAKQLAHGMGRAGRTTTDESFLEYLDNGNSVIVFENSASMQLEDCIVQPRNEFENRWRRLSFYLRKEDVLNDSRLAAQCTNFIMVDLFHGLGVVWNHFLAAAADHVSLLEDKIYENPADESRAPELWMNQASWLKVDKVMWLHSDLAKEMQEIMFELANVDDEENGVEVDWMASTPAEFERLQHKVSEDLLQPTNNLSELMYKSVGIRDSRQSLQLGLSMWRLSWITFIFLPLTFIVGFFGMNVDLFKDDPGIGWYFVAAAVLMVLVLILWYGVKHSLQRSRQTPYQRGLYEALFDHLEEEHPDLWTSAGASDDINPAQLSFTNRWRWRVLRRWFAPERTINRRLYSSLAQDDGGSELGAWASIKRYLLVRWLAQIKLKQPSVQSVELAMQSVELGQPSNYARVEARYESETIAELARLSTTAAVAEAEPIVAERLSTFGLRPLTHDEMRRQSEDRPSSRGSSGIIIEERTMSDSESDTGEGAPNRRNGTSRRASQ